MRLVERGTPEGGQKRCGGGVWRALVDWSRHWKITRVFRCRLRSTLGGPGVEAKSTKYTATYDASRVLYCLKQMGPSEALTLKELSMKLAMLLCLLTANRDQVLFHPSTMVQRDS